MDPGSSLEEASRDEELFFKCPKCSSLFSTTKRILEQDRYTKGSLTRAIMGGRMSPLAYVPKCTKCSSKLERISREEFQKEMESTTRSRA